LVHTSSLFSFVVRCAYYLPRLVLINMNKHTNETSYKKGNVPYTKGKELTEEHKTRIGESQKGEKGFWYGKKASTETRKKLSDMRRGKKHWNWRGGKKNRNYYGLDWNDIRKSIYERDLWTCQLCEKKNPKPIQCHHIVPFKVTQDNSPENLITLCCSCHSKEEYKCNQRIYNGLYKQKTR